MKKTLSTLCELFYAAHYVPMALCDNQKVMEIYSSLDRPLDFTRSALPKAREIKEKLRLFTAEDLGMYGFLRLKSEGGFLLVGPVFDRPVTENMVTLFSRKNGIGNRDWQVLYWFLSGIPRYTYNQFMNLLIYLFYTLTGERLSASELMNVPESREEKPIRREDMMSREERAKHETFQFENMILALVREGQTKKLQDFLTQVGKIGNFREGEVADTPLRQAKNILIGWTAVVGKTGAISGGVDIEETYGLIDLYTQECERASSVEAVKLLQYNMLMDFTQRVERNRRPKHVSPEIAQCMQYMQNHTGADLGIDEIAGVVGKSRTWLTKKFRAETGKSIGDFLTETKVQEAKRLLRYSDLTLSEIANLLCFSSQAYFQTVFKKATGVTPAAFRRS